MNFDTLFHRKGLGSKKWDEAHIHTGVTAERSLPMWVADMDFQPPACVIDTARRVTEAGDFGYFCGMEEFYASVAWWQENRHGWKVDPRWCLTTFGLGNAIAITLQTFSQPGDAVAFFTPVYHEFQMKTERNGRVARHLPLAKEGGKFVLDWDRYDALMTGTEKILIISSPHNPAGRVWTRDELKAIAEKFLSEEEMEKIKALGSWDEIMETLKKRLEEQEKRHQGGNKWVGTGGTSPYGNSGYHPEGVRIGGESKHKRAVKVWDKREFQNLDNTKELGTRNIKIAMRRLRRFARDGAVEELDIDGTINGTARQGWLDIKMRPERRNAIKVLLMLDVGGSMDPFIKLCEELFSAATSEFKNLEFFYFHNCPYEGVWKDNKRRFSERTQMWDVLHKFPHDYKVVMVGDASMSPYEITHPGGSVEHFNEESGAVWMNRITSTYPATVWLNPVPEKQWGYSQSTKIIKELMNDRMYPLTLEGLDDAMRELSRKHGH